MPEPTLAEIKADLITALQELNEALKRLAAKLALGKLASHGDTSGYQTTVWNPPKTNANTTDAHLDALSVTVLDSWLSQNKTEVERLLEEPD